MAEKKKKSKKKTKKQDPKFTKDQLINSKKFKFKKDILNALLDKNEKYSISEVEGVLKKYNKREVK